MKPTLTKHPRIFCYLLCLLCGASFAQSLNDGFDGNSINTGVWTPFTTSFGNSSISEGGGNAQFVNGAWLTTIAGFPGASVSGRFSIDGWEYDRFKVLIRSDGTSIDNHWQTRVGGIGIQFTAGANPDYGPSQTLQVINFQTGSLVGAAGPTINMNTFYDFLIKDNGTAISIYIGNLDAPALSVFTSASYGDKIELGNREQASSSGPPPYIVKLDSIAIVPEPSGLSLLALGVAVLALKSRFPKKQLLSYLRPK